MTSSNNTPTPANPQPVAGMLPDQPGKAGKPTRLASHAVSVSPDSDPIPDWLLNFARKIEPETALTQPEVSTEISLPDSVFSDQERIVASQLATPVEPQETNQQANLPPTFHPKSIWEEEDAVELGLVPEGMTLLDPINELKIMLDDDPNETVAFIRAHMQDADFRIEAAKTLRAYLTLDPGSEPLWQIFEQLQQPDSTQEARWKNL